MKTKWGIILVLVLAFFFRVYRLSSLPISLFGDEVDAGYQAWSLATTGRDYYGNFLPSYIRSLSEWRAPLTMYVIAPFVGLLGPSNFSARLPMAVLGVLSIYLTYLISNLLFPKKFIGLIAAAILALTPWHLHYTRNAVEQSPLFLLELLGVYLYLAAKEKPFLYTLSLLSFVLTFYTYSVANLATPTIIAVLLFCFPPKIKPLTNKKTLGGFLFCLLALLPIAYQLVAGQAAGRFKSINIANDKQVLDQIISDRNRPWLTNPVLEKVFNNRLTAIGGEFVKNYFTALSPQFMFISADPIYRHSVDHFGVFLLVLSPFFYTGLILLAGYRKDRRYLMLALWLLLIPVGSSLTQGGGNHAPRLFLMIFPVTVISALGLTWVVGLVKEKYRLLVSAIIFSAFVLNFSAYWYRYTTHYAYESSHVWQYGYEPLFTQSRTLIAKANRVFINNTAEPVFYRLAYFLPIRPSDFQEQFTTDVPTKNIIPGFDGFRFADKFYLGTASDLTGIKKLLRPGDLYFASQRTEIPGDWDLEKNPPAELKVHLTVRDFYDRPLFYVLSK